LYRSSPQTQGGTLVPLEPGDLAPLFSISLIQQEVATEREIEIPGPVRDVYRPWRTTPLYRARRLAQRCKEEGVSRAILFNLCGHGHFDMEAYIDFQAGRLVDQDYDPSELALAACRPRR
jgi:predicted alternative tryptophan synthase beta-subunit